MQDRRIRKTRDRLRQGLETLMQRNAIKDITVKELCDICDINRSTFYLHYTDVYDLLHSIETELLDAFYAIFNEIGDDNFFDYAKVSHSMVHLFDFLAENAAFCRILLCNNGDIAFIEQVKELVQARFLPLMQQRIGMDTPRSSFAFAFVVSGCIGMLQQWLSNNMPVPAKEMALITQTFFIKGVLALSEHQDVS